MSSPVPASSSDFSFAQIKSKVIAFGKEHATPYHLAVASVLGSITVVFFTVIALLIICAVNFNVLGLVE